ncbi:MAG: SGNH/GDSL hydrolase family protein [Thermoleophilaceae bacterium]|nr:SGNH/GDSL hydrolase family protein [Thermoleophilaceae bacterium]
MRRAAPLGLVLLALAGGCGAQPPAPTSGASAPTRPAAGRVIAALGDSITAGSPLWDPDPATRGQIAEPDEQSQFEYWAARGEDVSFRNCGVFGERTDEIATRLDECTAGADAIIVQGGINDIAQGRPVTEAARDLDAMVARGLEVGLETTIVEVLPWNNGYPDADPEIVALNKAIARIGERRGVEVLPFYSALEDPAAPGRMAAELTADGDHPSVEGYRELSELIPIR